MAVGKGTPENFIHLFERMSEPLGYGLRGGGGGSDDPMIYYYYDSQNMMDSMFDSELMKETVKLVMNRMMQAKRTGINVKMLAVPSMPKKMPDLTLIHDLCPKNKNFSYFLPPHRKAFSILKGIFMRQRNPDELFQMACACRDNPLINCQLFVYALSSCLVSRPDTLDVAIPSHVEISPENYCTNDVVRQANKMAGVSELLGSSTTKQGGGSSSGKAPKIIIDQNLTGRGTDPEQRMWYFREDILVNSHHFHWHIVYPVCTPKDPKAPGYRDRRGELFYYMHHSMIARYDTERICNGLPRTKKFDFANLVIEEGYFGKLSSENSGVQWGTRQAGTKLANISNSKFQIRVEELARWRDRILESIDLGYYVVKDPKTGMEARTKLDEVNGIDVLGNVVESSASLTPHAQYYGEAGFHNMGHVLIACSNDPRGKHKEHEGVMGDVATAMRDPAFYRWHKYIDHLFDFYKKTLPPYPLDSDGKSKYPLRWKGIEIRPFSFYVRALDTQERNVLKTFWDYKDVDLSRGLDFRRSATAGVKRTPVMGRFTHLNHTPFDYFMEIANNTGKPALATIRIFMAPKYDENGDPFSLEEQRLLFFEMDKVAQPLKIGLNKVRIASTNSSVTLRDEEGSSFRNLEKLYLEASSRSNVVKGSQCSCGWPQHLLLPKGSSEGTDYDLFVIVTDGSQDNLLDVNRNTGCNSALSFCGVLNKKFPDARPMGYPFDRLPYQIHVAGTNDILDQCPSEMVTVPTLEKYVKDIKNSAMGKVTIIHEMTMKKPQDAMNEQVMNPDGKCVQLKDFYKNQSRGNDKNPNIPSTDRPTSPSREPINRLSRFPPGRENIGIGQSQVQWPVIGRGRGRGLHSRYGRQDDLDDEDWEHLESEDNY